MRFFYVTCLILAGLTVAPISIARATTPSDKDVQPDRTLLQELTQMTVIRLGHGFDASGREQRCRARTSENKKKVSYTDAMKSCLSAGHTVVVCEDGRQLCSKPIASAN